MYKIGRLIFYLTYNDLPSGIFSSQVIEVVKYLNTEFNKDVRLVSFISVRNFFTNRKRIKRELSNALVFPMYPKVSNWRKNRIVLNVCCSLYRPSEIIGRSVLATQLALCAKATGKCKTVVYDGRGAIAAELVEYHVVNDEQLIREMPSLERDSILRSDLRMAVSNALVKHWKEQFNYMDHLHVTIPCTLNKVFEKTELNTETITASRKKLGLSRTDIVFVYSGSLAGWQSLDMMMSFLQVQLSSSSQKKVLFLTEKAGVIDQLEEKFPEQVIQKKVNANEVPQFLVSGDHALLIRERTVTNKVASPVKFAEYLACGLKVIISEELGDYTEFVIKNSMGEIFGRKDDYEPIALDEKNRLRAVAMSIFSKSNYRMQYERLITFN